MLDKESHPADFYILNEILKQVQDDAVLIISDYGYSNNFLNKSIMANIIQQAYQYNEMSMSNLSTSDRLKASRLGKKIVLGINQIYKKNQDPKLMDLMKLVTVKKRKIEKRLKGRLEF